MAHQRRGATRPPSSTGVIECCIDNEAAALSLSPSRSADDLILIDGGVVTTNNSSTYKSKSSDMSVSQHSNNHVYYSDSGSGRPHSGSGRPRRRPHPANTAFIAAPGYSYADPNLMRSTNEAKHGGAQSISKNNSGVVPIPVAVLLWYLLGVVSIASSKILLSTNNVPPLVLTLQQLIIGMTLLHTLLEMQTSGEKDKDESLHRGLQPIPMQVRGDSASTDGTTTTTNNNCPEKGESGKLKRKSSTNDNDGTDVRGNYSDGTILSAIMALAKPSSHTHIHNQLLLAAIYFALGFLLTNYGFQSGSAAFVETVKAAEPFTSATVAVIWGIERLGKEEMTSLTGIVAGVVLSTLGHRGSTPKTATADNGDDIILEITSSQSLTTKCLIVMLANLCFSFRGLHQKLFRSTPQGKASMVDDLNLQYRMQQIGVLMLIVPTLLGNTVWALGKLQHISLAESTAKDVLHYILLSLVNGVAFTSYNLASTYVLTRISVVHHAALNCIRRVFAIIVTSIIFGLEITILQILGIGLAVSGFFSYMHFKMKSQKKDKRRKDLREKWGGIMVDAKSGKWIGKSSSLLPVNNATE